MIAEIASLLMVTGISVGPLYSAAFGPALYRPLDKAVTNWRLESVRFLDLSQEHAAAILSGKEPPRLPRCVKLNNYWCIKSARWNGEIATDNEGHVAFASAVEGATVAASLLRRYYLEFDRKTALSIVTRWAPAQCGFVAAGPARGKKGKKGRAVAPSRADGLTTRGIGSTLRARFLASRGRGGAVRGGRRPLIRSVVPDRVAPMLRAPTIAAGMGEREMKLGSLSLASLGSIGGSGGALSGGGASGPRLSCAGENVRIQNYASSIAQGLVKTVNDDLKLFGANGAPTPSLARAMANMAAVEIGPFRAGQPLIDRVIAAAIRTVEEKRLKMEADLTAAAR